MNNEDRKSQLFLKSIPCLICYMFRLGL